MHTIEEVESKEAFVVQSTGVVLPYRLGKESGSPWRTHKNQALDTLMVGVHDNNPEVIFGMGGILVVDFDKENLVGFDNMVDLQLDLWEDGKGRWQVTRSRTDGVKVFILTPYGNLSKFKRKDLYRLIRAYLPEKYHPCIDYSADPRRTYVTDRMMPFIQEALAELKPIPAPIKESSYKYRPIRVGVGRKGNWELFICYLATFKDMATRAGEVNLSSRVVGKGFGVHHTIAARYLKRAVNEGYLTLINKSIIQGIKAYTYGLTAKLINNQNPTTLVPVILCSFSYSSSFDSSSYVVSSLPRAIDDHEWNRTMVLISKLNITNDVFSGWFYTLPGYNLKDREDQFKRILKSRNKRLAGLRQNGPRRPLEWAISHV